MPSPDRPAMHPDEPTMRLVGPLPSLLGAPRAEELSPRGPANRAHVALRTTGELLLTGALIVLLFLVYQVSVADEVAQHQQDSLVDRVHEQWEQSAPRGDPQEPVPGDAVAVLYVPRLGADYRRAVVEGTDRAHLAQGPGHYLGTAMPGQLGNFAVAGHRDGRGSPFKELDELQPGDPVVVETVDTWFVYRVLGDADSGTFTSDPSGIVGREIVDPTTVRVISPTPNQPASAPATGSYLTLTTCHPEYSSRQRLIIHAVLEGAGTPKSQLPDGPAELAAG